MSKAKELKQDLDSKRTQYMAIWEPKKDTLEFTEEEVESMQALQKEMSDIGRKWEIAHLSETADDLQRQIMRENQPVNRLQPPVTVDSNAVIAQHGAKSLAMVFAESQAYQSLRAGVIKQASIDVPYATLEREMGKKTLLTSGDWSIQSTRLPQMLESVQTDITVSDLMMQGTVDGPSFSYMEETTFTNAAAEVAEGGTKPESALDFTETTEQVRKIATNIPVTDEMLQDVPQMESFIRGRLGFMVERRREAQLLSGNGTTPNLRGILARTGLQTQARGSDPEPDAVYKAIIKVNVNADAEPTAVVMHPTNWQFIRLLRTADGIYIWGNPSDPGVDRIWGLPVRKTTGITLGTALVGAFRPYAEVRRRTGLTVNLFDQHSTYAVENKVLVQAEERLGLAVYRPAAFCSVTGMQ